jgi:alkylated DNA repair dioxygenase AlkB
MKLFEPEIDSSKNWLPKEGCVQYYGPILPFNEAEKFFALLRNTIKWENDIAIIFGKRIVTKRKVAWYGDQAFEYGYSNTKKTALFWTEELLKIKALVERESGEQFNSCLLNLYHNGNEGMAWHSDAEKELKENGCIASLSLGAERKFAFKHKRTQEKIELFLESGSLLLMKEETQKNWLHRLPPTKKIEKARINLTFRTIT